MFNRFLFSKTDTLKETGTILFNAGEAHKHICCHRLDSPCSPLCSMYVPASVLDRKTSEDRYYIYTSYCLEVENVCLNIKKQGS